MSAPASSGVNGGISNARCPLSPTAMGRRSLRHDVMTLTPSIGSTLMLRSKTCANDVEPVSSAASAEWSIASRISVTLASARDIGLANRSGCSHRLGDAARLVLKLLRLGLWTRVSVRASRRPTGCVTMNVQFTLTTSRKR